MVSYEHHSVLLEVHPGESFPSISIGEGREKEEDAGWEILGNGGRCNLRARVAAPVLQVRNEPCDMERRVRHLHAQQLGKKLAPRWWREILRKKYLCQRDFNV